MIGTLMTVLLLACGTANVAHADNDDITINKNTSSNTNNVTATSTATSTATGGNATATGGNASSTLNYTERQQLPSMGQNFQPGNLPVAYGDYGHLNTEFNLDLAGSVTWTTEGINTMIAVMQETNGAEKWDEICNRIKPNPIIVKRFSPTSSVTVMSPDEFRPEMVNQSTLAGFLIPDAEFNKNHPVLPLHLQAYTALNAMHFGSTHIVKMDQSFQSRFLSGSSGFSLNGIVSKLLGCDLGAVLGAGSGVSNGKNIKYGSAGVAYMVLHIEARPRPVVEKQPCNDCGDLSEVFADLAMWQQKIAGCHFFSADNLSYRVPSAECNIELYACTRDQKYLRAAEKDLDWALKNYEKGSDTRVGKRAVESLKLYKRAIILQATVLQAQGKAHEAQVHAKKYGVEHWGSDFVPASRKK